MSAPVCDGDSMAAFGDGYAMLSAVQQTAFERTVPLNVMI